MANTLIMARKFIENRSLLTQTFINDGVEQQLQWMSAEDNADNDGLVCLLISFFKV